MKILFFGGTSALSKSLIPKFSETSDVITAGRKNCDIEIDLNEDINKLNFPEGIDVIIHTAAHFEGESDKDFVDSINVNVLGTLKLCQLSNKAKIKQFILISSMSATLKRDNDYYGIYALSKKHAEDVAEFYCNKYDLPLTILRPSQIYGGDLSMSKNQPYIYNVIMKAEKGEDILIYGRHNAIRNYIHVDDLGEIINRVIYQKVKGIYSCVFTEDISFSDIAKFAYKAFQKNGKIIFLKDLPNIQDNYFEIDDTLYRKINFFPKISVEQGMIKIAQLKSKCQ